jgi:hypothetical protein
MKTEQFNQIVNARCATTIEVLRCKAGEYAYGDRLSNFKKIAAFRGVEPEEALMGLVVKHIVALDDFIQALPDNPQSHDRFVEKLQDIIAYMILLEALRIEATQVIEESDAQ